VPTSTPAAPYPPAIIQNAQAKASSGLYTAISTETGAAAPAPLSSLAITPSAFNSFLMSSSCAASTDTSAEITHDMTQPLCDYYISSSHNTYLVGHQLVGDSTIEGYIRALLHGCRSVELDVYDGDIEPCVTHGNTLTSRVPVRDIARAIAKYAFVASPYPIIISAEVHCNLAQQAFLAKILQEEFGDALVSAPIDGRPSISVLPSPEDLKGRVLLKAKNLYVTERDGLQEMKDKAVVVGQEESTTDTTDTSSQSESERGGEGSSGGGGVKGRVSNLFRKVRGKSPKPRADSAMPASGNTHGSGSVPRRSATEPLPKTKMSEDIVALLVYTVGVKCRGLNKKEVYAPEHMFSLSERTAGRVMKEGAMDLVKHTRGHLVRIYPKGIRVSSSNYHPHRFWAAGAQLVALNWQTSGKCLLISKLDAKLKLTMSAHRSRHDDQPRHVPAQRPCRLRPQAPGPASKRTRAPTETHPALL
jgi:phosphatidylinositol phospholipase C delta